nr:EOG090X09U7 [Lepidurus arcticus]
MTAKLTELKDQHDNKSKVRLDKRVWVMFASLILDLLAFTIILPLFPSLVDMYATREKGTSGLYAQLSLAVLSVQESVGIPAQFSGVLFGGFLGSMFSLLQFFVSPIAGSFSDSYGRKPALLLSLVGVAISYAMWYMSSSFAMFVAARIVGGISKANVSLATAIMADVTGIKDRGIAMALVGVAFSLGFMVGPMLGAWFAIGLKNQGLVGEWYQLPAAVSLALAVTNVVFVAVAFKESLPKERRSASLVSSLSQAWNLINPFALLNFSAIEGLPRKDTDRLKKLGRVYFLFLFLYSGLEFTLTFLVHMRLNWGAAHQGKMFLFIGIIMALVQGGFSRRIKPGKENSFALLGLLLVIPSFVIIGIASSAPILFVGLAFYSFASATVVPCLTTMVSSFGNSNQKGVLMGVFRSIGALARALGPAVASSVGLSSEIGKAFLGYIDRRVPMHLGVSVCDPVARRRATAYQAPTKEMCEIRI